MPRKAREELGNLMEKEIIALCYCLMNEVPRVVKLGQPCILLQWSRLLGSGVSSLILFVSSFASGATPGIVNDVGG